MLLFSRTTGTDKSNNIEGSPNPLFVNAAAGDFRLQAGSPAIAAGVVMPGLSFLGSAPDMGALQRGLVDSFPRQQILDS